MKKILITGALGQIGSELMVALQKRHGFDNVVATDIRKPPQVDGIFEVLDCTCSHRLHETVIKHDIGTIYHLAALLSAVAEARPQDAWRVNMDGTLHVLEAARIHGCSVFTPSSIGAFGPTTPADNTPQDTIQRPTSMYGVTKVAGELLCDYYARRYGVDTRGLRYPGIISNVTPPGGGTTDYAVDIYYSAVQQGKYTCFLRKDTFLDMMYMPDAIEAAINLMEADASKLKHRNAFNVSAMSFAPEHIAAEIKKHLPGFTMDYQIDPVRQGIADSWPNHMDDSAAREEWGWSPKYDLVSMTADMISVLKNRFGK
ncbi:L-threonine 3-dehydrogenase [Myxococcota bacterium]|nr:L-threonine 3-dehydrogenase [Myxococcota bacterium]MBU1410563.1 L-threonine 3-dehydrogenase [Myxococcota bacterium]MBU1510441.1 L-threonine 3-dehydrogenase [Myxococcota bacterium]